MLLSSFISVFEIENHPADLASQEMASNDGSSLLIRAKAVAWTFAEESLCVAILTPLILACL
jgi:hypothetical protein